MVDIHVNVSTNQLEDYLQYVKQKKAIKNLEVGKALEPG